MSTTENEGNDLGEDNTQTNQEENAVIEPKSSDTQELQTIFLESSGDACVPTKSDSGKVCVQESSNFTIGDTHIHHHNYGTSSNVDVCEGEHNMTPEKAANIAEKHYSNRLVTKYEDAIQATEGDFDVMSDHYKPVEVVCKVNNSKGCQDISFDKQQQTTHLLDLLTEQATPMVIEADAGMGKTTYLKRIKVEWTQNEVLRQRFPLAFFIPLRKVKHDTLVEIICKDLGLLPEEDMKILQRYIDYYPQKILFLVDGMDEAKLNVQSEIFGLLRKSKIHLILTTRPISNQSTQQLPKTKYLHVKMNGFSPNVLRDYISKQLNGNDQETKKLQNECEKHLLSHSLLKVPLYAFLICFLWKKQKNVFSDTATQLFNSFLKLLLTQYMERTNGVSAQIEFNKSPFEETVPKSIRHLLYLIANLAHATLSAGRTHFDKTDVEKHFLEMSDIQNLGLFCVESEKDSLIYFRHKLFHEYFMGLHLSISEGDRVFLLSSNFESIVNKSHISQHAVYFAAGLSVEAFDNLYATCDKLEDENPLSNFSSLMAHVLTSQLLFENQESENIDQKLVPNTIVVYVRSAHSVASAIFLLNKMLQQEKAQEKTTISDKGSEKKNLQLQHIIRKMERSRHLIKSTHLELRNTFVVIGSDEYCSDELQKILPETRQSDSFDHLLLQNPNLALLYEIFAEKWPHVTKFSLKFDVMKTEECPSLEDILLCFSNVKKIKITCMLKSTKCHEAKEPMECPIAKSIHVCFGGKSRGRLNNRCPLYNNSMINKTSLKLKIKKGNPETGCDFISGVEDRIQSVCFHEERSSRWPVKEMFVKCQHLDSVCIALVEMLYERDLIGELPKSVESLYIKCKSEDVSHFGQFGDILSLHCDVFEHIKTIVIGLDYGSEDDTANDPVVRFHTFMKKLIGFLKEGENTLNLVSFVIPYHLTNGEFQTLEDFNSSSGSWSVKVGHGDTGCELKSPGYLYNKCCKYKKSKFIEHGIFRIGEGSPILHIVYEKASQKRSYPTDSEPDEQVEVKKVKDVNN